MAIVSGPAAIIKFLWKAHLTADVPTEEEAEQKERRRAVMWLNTVGPGYLWVTWPKKRQCQGIKFNAKTLDVIHAFRARANEGRAL